MDADLLRKVRDGGFVTSDISSRSQYQNCSKKAGTRWGSLLRFNR